MEMKELKICAASAIFIAVFVGLCAIFLGCSGPKACEQEKTVIKEKEISVQVPAIMDTLELKSKSAADSLLSGITATPSGDTANFTYNRTSNILAFKIKPAPIKTKFIDTTTIKYQKDKADSPAKPEKVDKYPFLSKVGLFAIGVIIGIIILAGYYIIKNFFKI